MLGTTKQDAHIQRLEGEIFQGQNRERRDERWAERGDRLKRFVAGQPVENVWVLDLYPLLEALYGRYLRAMVAGRPEAVWALRALEDLVSSVAGSVQLGEGAFRRMTERRMVDYIRNHP